MRFLSLIVGKKKQNTFGASLSKKVWIQSQASLSQHPCFLPTTFLWIRVEWQGATESFG